MSNTRSHFSLPFIRRLVGGFAALGSFVSIGGCPSWCGRQVTLTGSGPSPVLDEFLHVANLRRGRAELIVHGRQRAWWYDRVAGQCLSDRQSEIATIEQLRAFADEANPMSFLLVPHGTGRRTIDRDQDGFNNRDELDFGSDPTNPLSIPLRGYLSLLAPDGFKLSWNSQSGQTYRVQFNHTLTASNWTDLSQDIVAVGTNTAFSIPVTSDPQRFLRIKAGE